MLRRFRERRARIEVLADALISGRGPEAYSEARWRAHVAGSDTAAKEWRAVAATIARKLADAGGLAGLDQDVAPASDTLTTRAV